MKKPSLTLRHLCFTGPGRDAASVSFGPGLNVIYGASETGKSLIVETIDFMLGASKPLRDIPERVGFDRIFLGIAASDGTSFTLERSTAGGNFRCYEGLHFSVPSGTQPVTLAAKHSPVKDNNISTFLLRKIGLDSKRIRKNAKGQTNSLSFRNLVPFCVVSEESIQKQASLIETGEILTRTSEMSMFKLLLTGVDDSAVQPETREPSDRLSKSAKLEVIEELIADYRERLSNLVDDEEDNVLQSQLLAIEDDLAREQSLLAQTEQSYRAVMTRRNQLRQDLESASERRTEIDEMLARFALLDSHYNSDLSRLEGLREAGSLVSALGPDSCPLCGALPESQHRDGDCDGNIDAVIAAADAETAKISRLRQELQETIGQLRTEGARFDEIRPALGHNLEQADRELVNMSPAVANQRSAYSDLIQKRSIVQNALNILTTISDLEDRKASIDGASTNSGITEPTHSDLSESVLDKFSADLEAVLKSWNFPDASRVHFVKEARDFVIAGKPRGSRGKGMRAITHAAFTIALLEFTLRNDLPHPGFVVIDTPLLAYREPDGEEDDLSGTDVQERFYEYLAAQQSGQVIILENVDPPQSVKDLDQSIFFTKNPHSGRYGFFPRRDNSI